jgi:hypothetical protein
MSNIDYVYIDDGVREDDLHKAVEAQGRVAIAAIRHRINISIPEGEKAAISAWLDVLATMLAHQGDPTRDCSDVLLYSDGSAVLRLIPDDNADVEARDYRDDSDADDYIGDLAETLATSLAGYKVQVNAPPLQAHREPGLLWSRLLDRR